MYLLLGARVLDEVKLQQSLAFRIPKGSKRGDLYGI